MWLYGRIGARYSKRRARVWGLVWAVAGLVLVGAGSARAVVDLPGYTPNMILTPEEYIVSGDITVPIFGTLTIQSGAKLFFKPNTGITVWGKLVADGALFTSNAQLATPPNPASGDWGQIKFEDGSTGTLVDCIVEYGGVRSTATIAQVEASRGATVLIQKSDILSGKGPAVYVNASGVSVASFTLSGCGIAGNMNGTTDATKGSIQIGDTGGLPVRATIGACTISQSGGDAGSQNGAVLRGNLSADEVLLEGNTFGGNGTGIRFIDAPAAATIADNTFLDHREQAVLGTLFNASKWRIGRRANGKEALNYFTGMTGIAGVVLSGGNYESVLATLSVPGKDASRMVAPYRISGELTISKNTVLTIDPGVVIQLELGQVLCVSGPVPPGPFGTLLAKGTEEAPVTFTSTATGEGLYPKRPGEWGAVTVNEGATAILRYCVFEWGGRGTGVEAMVCAKSSNYAKGTLDIRDSLIANSGSAGLKVYSDRYYQPSVFVSGCHLIGNQALQTNTAGTSGAVIFGGDDGLSSHSPSATLLHCEVLDTGPQGNKQTGVYVGAIANAQSVFIAENWIAGNRKGIYLNTWMYNGTIAAAASMYGNTITGNAEDAISGTFNRAPLPIGYKDRWTEGA